jgi:DNA-binding transcriptional MocR family regulator
MFSASGGFRNFIRLNCGHPWSEDLELAVGRLGQLAAKLM